MTLKITLGILALLVVMWLAYKAIARAIDLASRQMSALLPEPTPWFPAEYIPVNQGLYKSRAVNLRHAKVEMTVWKNGRWYYEAGGLECYFQKREWQGLTEPMQ